MKPIDVNSIEQLEEALKARAIKNIHLQLFYWVSPKTSTRYNTFVGFVDDEEVVVGENPQGSNEYHIETNALKRVLLKKEIYLTKEFYNFLHFGKLGSLSVLSKLIKYTEEEVTRKRDLPSRD